MIKYNEFEVNEILANDQILKLTLVPHMHPTCNTHDIQLLVIEVKKIEKKLTKIELLNKEKFIDNEH